MTIDHTRPQDYRFREGCKVVRIIPTPESTGEFSKLIVLYRGRDGSVYFAATSADGKWGPGDSSFDLIPHDPVLYYANVWKNSFGPGFAGLWNCIQSCRSSDSVPIARVAVHQSGEIRKIPLDATTDPEAQP